MIDEKEMADARTMEEDMETSNNISWLNKRVVELEAEVKQLREQPRVTIDEWDIKPDGNADAEPLPCVTVYLDGCEYVGRLRLYKDEEGKVIE